MPKKGAFYYFLIDIQNEFFKERGIREKLNDIKELATNRWNRLSSKEKKVYEEYAIFEREKKGKIFDYDGTVVTLNYATAIDNIQDEIATFNSIKTLIQELYSSGNLIEHGFLFVTFNYLCKNFDIKAIPREIGVLEFSLKHGILREFHTFIKVKNIPIGQASTALSTTLEYHGIPTSNFEFDVDDYWGICQFICQFVKTKFNDKRHIVFCDKNFIGQNSQSMDWLLEEGEEMSHKFVFVDVAFLIIELSKISKSSNYSQASIDNILKNPTYDFCGGICCMFHNEIDNPLCSRADVHKMVFYLSEIVLPTFHIKCTRNHLPVFLTKQKTYELYDKKFGPQPLLFKPNPALIEGSVTSKNQDLMSPRNAKSFALQIPTSSQKLMRPNSDLGTPSLENKKLFPFPNPIPLVGDTDIGCMFVTTQSRNFPSMTGPDKPFQSTPIHSSQISTRTIPVYKTPPFDNSIGDTNAYCKPVICQPRIIPSSTEPYKPCLFTQNSTRPIAVFETPALETKKLTFFPNPLSPIEEVDTHYRPVTLQQRAIPSSIELDKPYLSTPIYPTQSASSVSILEAPAFEIQRQTSFSNPLPSDTYGKPMAFQPRTVSFSSGHDKPYLSTPIYPTRNSIPNFETPVLEMKKLAPFTLPSEENADIYYRPVTLQPMTISSSYEPDIPYHSTPIYQTQKSTRLIPVSDTPRTVPNSTRPDNPHQSTLIYQTQKSSRPIPATKNSSIEMKRKTPFTNLSSFVEADIYLKPVTFQQRAIPSLIRSNKLSLSTSNFPSETNQKPQLSSTSRTTSILMEDDDDVPIIQISNFEMWQSSSDPNQNLQLPFTPRTTSIPMEDDDDDPIIQISNFEMWQSPSDLQINLSVKEVQHDTHAFKIKRPNYYNNSLPPDDTYCRPMTLQLQTVPYSTRPDNPYQSTSINQTQKSTRPISASETSDFEMKRQTSFTNLLPFVEADAYFKPVTSQQRAIPSSFRPYMLSLSTPNFPSETNQKLQIPSTSRNTLIPMEEDEDVPIIQISNFEMWQSPSDPQINLSVKEIQHEEAFDFNPEMSRVLFRKSNFACDSGIGGLPPNTRTADLIRGHYNQPAQDK